MGRKIVFLLMLAALAGGNCFASKIIHQTGVTGKTAAFNCPESCIGHQATIWAVGFKRGENITVTLTFADPGGEELATAMANYNNQYSNSSKMEQAVLNCTFTAKAGSYTLTLGGNSESENISQINSILVICWGCPGEDITVIQTELTAEINQLKNELEGTVNTRMAELQLRIGALQTQFNVAIAKHDADQAALLKQIQDFKSEINSLAAELQYNVARLERQQAEYLAQLEIIKIAYQKDVEMLNLRIANLDAKYAAEVASLKSDVAKITADLNALDARFLAADQQLKTQLTSLENQQTALQQQLNLAEQQHRNDVSALQSQIDAKTELIRTEHSADVKRLENSIDGADSKYEAESARLNTEVIKTNNTLAQAIRDYTAADGALQSQVDQLTAGQVSLQSELATLATEHSRDIAEVKNKIETADSQLLALHNADVRLLEQSISTLNSRYQASTDSLSSALNQTNAQLAQAVRDSNAADSALQEKINGLTAGQASLRNQLTVLETAHNRDVAELKTLISNKESALEAQHDADIKLLQQSIADLDSRYRASADSLTAGLSQTNTRLMQLEKDYRDGDFALKEEIDRLKQEQLLQKNALAVLETRHNQDVVMLRSEASAKYAQLESSHAADVNLLNQKISELNSTYADKVSVLNTELSRTNATLTQLAKDSTAGDRELQEKIDVLVQQQTAQKNALALLEAEHNRDTAVLRSEYTTKLEKLQDKHDSDAAQLALQMNNLNSTYADKVSQINRELDSISSDLARMARDYTNGDKELREQVEALRLQQLTQQNTLANLKETHTKDVAALQKDLTAAQAALREKIDVEVADLRQDMLALDNKYKDSVADLKTQLSNISGKLESEVAKLSATDRDLYDKISDLREKQADYYARMEILKLTHEKDKETLEKEIAGLDAKYKEECAAINTKIASVQDQVAALQAKHRNDVAALQGQIDSTVNKLDNEIRNIYLELAAVKTEQDAHRTATQQALDELQLRMTELDKSVTERLKNLENRIRYAVYSDEKLEALKKDFEAQIRAKEKEIADLDLEIQEMADAGLDTSARETTRTRLLQELLKLRNELTDIEFAILIRHDESEFAEHEKEIALLKAEIAALRFSTDLLVKQLRDDLLAAEAQYLKLLEEAKADAAGQTAVVQKQLDDLKAQVLAFVEALRNERETGDAELKALLDAIDVSHRELIGELDKTIADKLDKLKFETDAQFENLRSTINNIAYQQRFSTGGNASAYSLPDAQAQEVPVDSRDLRVSPDAALDSTLN